MIETEKWLQEDAELILGQKFPENNDPENTYLAFCGLTCIPILDLVPFKYLYNKKKIEKQNKKQGVLEKKLLID